MRENHRLELSKKILAALDAGDSWIVSVKSPSGIYASVHIFTTPAGHIATKVVSEDALPAEEDAEITRFLHDILGSTEEDVLFDAKGTTEEVEKKFRKAVGGGQG